MPHSAKKKRTDDHTKNKKAKGERRWIMMLMGARRAVACAGPLASPQGGVRQLGTRVFNPGKGRGKRSLAKKRDYNKHNNKQQGGAVHENNNNNKGD